MNLPAQLTFGNFNLQTFGLFMVLGFLITMFIVWLEGKKDGFDEERLFDMLLLASVSAILISRLFFAASHTVTFGAFFGHIYRFWESGYNISGALLGFLLPLYLLCRAWKWSFYRIVDIFSLGMSLGLSVILLGFVALQGRFEFLFAFAAWVFLFALLSKFRNSRIKSGYAFSIFLAVNALLGLIFFRLREYLIFYLLLVTLSTVVFLFRWRLENYDINITSGIIDRIKKAARKQAE